MKIVPVFYDNMNHETVLDRAQNLKGENISPELFMGKLEFGDIFRQHSPARFMKVNTDLMEDQGIFINDIIVIDPNTDCLNGKIVVVLVNSTMMIRRYEKIKSGLILYGDSKKISPLNIEEGYDQFKLLGVVVYVIKPV